VTPARAARDTAEFPDAAFGREVQIELVRLHARIIRRMPWVQSILAACIGLIVLRYVALAAFAIWCGISIGIESLRANYADHVLRRAAPIDSRRTHRAFVVWALAAGAAVGVGAAFCFPRLPINDQSVLGIVLFAMPAAGVAVSQSSRYIAAAYCLSILLPASGCWMLLYPHQALSVVVMTLVYCAFIILVAVEGELLLLRSVIIRHERDRLVRDLEKRNADVREAMERAEQAAQSRARVLATASHDLRQPLHALSIYSAVLAAGPAPEQLREVGANIDQIVRSLGSLLHGLLDLSRLTVGHYEPEHKRVALEGVVESVCAEYRRFAADKGLELRLRVAPVRVLGDAVAIGRIVRNLLDNAIKYTMQGSIDVRLALEREGDDAIAVISVADTGPGIAPEQQARIFEEFYQLDNPGRDRGRGVGLGLAIVQRLCELIGAQINVESVPAAGATFRLRLPHVLAEEHTATTPTESDESALLQDRSVYLVDNENDILHGTQRLLESWGMRTAIANSADAAEHLFREHGVPELLITDLRLRGAEHGAELAARLRRTFAPFPVLVITGEVSAIAVAQVDALDATLLYKPITPELLRRAIVRALAPAH